MKKFTFFSAIIAGLILIPFSADAQYKNKKNQEEAPKTEAQLLLEKVDSAKTPVVLTLDDALKIALSENVSVKVADLEIKRSEYAKKGAYAALFPQIDLTGSYQRTIKKQVMYMTMGGQSMGIEVGKSNTINAGASAAMPLVNAQLWGSLKLSALDVELSVEKARSSRLDMVTQVKNAYFGTLFAKIAATVFLCVTLMLAGKPLSALYSSDPATINASAGLLWVLLVMDIAGVSINAIDPQLKAGGDATFVMLITVSAVWLIRLPLTWLFCFKLNMGVLGIYIANAISLYFRAVAGFIRHCGNKWYAKKI